MPCNQLTKIKVMQNQNVSEAIKQLIDLAKTDLSINPIVRAQIIKIAEKIKQNI